MWRTIVGVSIVVVALICVAGFAAKSFHQPIAIEEPASPPVPTAPDVGDIHFTYFGAKWCGPCRHMEQSTLHNQAVKDALEKKFGMNVAIIDIDQMPKMAEAFNITLIPTYLIIRDDKTIKRGVGWLGPNDFLEWIK